MSISSLSWCRKQAYVLSIPEQKVGLYFLSILKQEVGLYLLYPGVGSRPISFLSWSRTQASIISILEQEVGLYPLYPGVGSMPISSLPWSRKYAYILSILEQEVCLYPLFPGVQATFPGSQLHFLVFFSYISQLIATLPETWFPDTFPGF